MSNLAALIDRVELDLKDTANDTWSTDELTQHIRRALARYNWVDPRGAIVELDSLADTREYSLSALTGLMEVFDVWYPYDPSDPDHPPNRPEWSEWLNGTLYLEVADAPSGASDEKIRLFYTLGHTIEDLDSASSTTLDARGEMVVVLGASAYAVQQLALDRIGEVTVSGRTPRQLHDWAAARMEVFEEALGEVRRRAMLMFEPRVPWRAASRDEGRGGIV